MSATNYDGDVVAIIGLVRLEVAKLVNEAKEGTIKLCVRTDLNENVDGEQLSINFVKAFITVNTFIDGNVDSSLDGTKSRTDTRKKGVHIQITIGHMLVLDCNGNDMMFNKNSHSKKGKNHNNFLALVQ